MLLNKHLLNLMKRYNYLKKSSNSLINVFVSFNITLMKRVIIKMIYLYKYILCITKLFMY